METLVILAAGAATVLACILVVTLSKGTRRAPLRLPREQEWEDNAEVVSKVLMQPQANPIDPGAQVLDTGAGRFIGGPVIEGEVIHPHERDGDRQEAGPPETFDAEELDSRMLDQLLDQQSRELKQVQSRDEPSHEPSHEPPHEPPHETGSRSAR